DRKRQLTQENKFASIIPRQLSKANSRLCISPGMAIAPLILHEFPWEAISKHALRWKSAAKIAAPPAARHGSACSRAYAHRPSAPAVQRQCGAGSQNRV